MEEINKQLDTILNLADHYLVKSREDTSNYYDEFLEAAEILKSVMTDKEFKFWLAEKMLMKQQSLFAKDIYSICC